MNYDKLSNEDFWLLHHSTLSDEETMRLRDAKINALWEEELNAPLLKLSQAPENKPDPL